MVSNNKQLKMLDKNLEATRKEKRLKILATDEINSIYNPHSALQ